MNFEDYLSPACATLASAFLAIFLSEQFYSKFVCNTSSYLKKVDKYNELKRRQLDLDKQSKDLKLKALNSSSSESSIESKLSEDQKQEYQSNMTVLRNLKRSIQKDRHIGQLFTALLSGIFINLLSYVFKSQPVAMIPFKPFHIFASITSYNLDKDVIQNETERQPISAAFLFILAFLSFRSAIRKICFEKTTRLAPFHNMSISIPRRVFLTKEIQWGSYDENWKETVQLFTGYVLSTWYSVYSIYKVLKKYNSIKYVVSITRVISRMTGFCCSLYLPVFMRYIVYGAYAKFYQIDMSEVEDPDFGNYETFTKFFTRRLKAGARPIFEPENELSMCSPCDGKVLTCGVVNSQYSTVDCVKGRSYRLYEFMLGVQGDDQDQKQPTEEIPNNTQIASMIEKVKQRGNQLYWMVIYLSPADYHRFHSPCLHTADYRRHVVGYLSPVKPSHVNKHKDVFKNNERVNIFGRWAQGFYFESAVGATNVGSIKMDFDEEVMTNMTCPQYPYYEDKSYLKSATLDKSGPFNKYLTQQEFSKKTLEADSDFLRMEKGEMTGRFEMGSTIVLIFEADKNTELAIKEGQKLNLGDKLVTRQ